MEDTIILKQHYCYMFMLDRVKEELTTQEKLIEYFDKYDICNWLGQEEKGEKTDKLHWQMIIWSEHIKTNKQVVAMRKYWTDRLGKATCAIKSGRKIASLAAYSTKEGVGITNLPKAVLERIPKWKNKTAEKVQWNEMLTNYIEDMDLKNKTSTQFAVEIMEFHKANNKRPSRSSMQYLMWQYGKLNSHDLLYQWRLIPDINDYDESINNI